MGEIHAGQLSGLCLLPVGTADPFDVVGYPELPSGADAARTGYVADRGVTSLVV